MAAIETLKTQKLTPTVGADVLDVDLDRLVSDDALPQAVLQALEENGVLVFRELHVDDETQVAFCRKLGDLRLFPDNPVPGIFVVSLDPEKSPHAEYTKATVEWHIDGAIDEASPVKATVLTAKVVAAEGGETEFANAYAAYDDLSAEDKERYAKLRVFHSFVASQRKTYPNPTPEQLADWKRRGGREQPLVWTHRSGRRSLVLGVTADYVVGMDEEQGRALLADLLARATTLDRVYTHSWSVGDTVIWDNRGVFHRVQPYTPDSQREMHRTNILGDEPIE